MIALIGLHAATAERLPHISHCKTSMPPLAQSCFYAWREKKVREKDVVLPKRTLQFKVVNYADRCHMAPGVVGPREGLSSLIASFLSS